MEKRGQKRCCAGGRGKGLNEERNGIPGEGAGVGETAEGGKTGAGGRRRETAPRRGRRPVTLALIAALLLAAMFCVRLLGQYRALKMPYEDALREADEAFAAAAAEYDEARPDSAPSAEKRRQAWAEMIEEAKEELARLERRCAELDGEIREAEEKIGAFEQSEDYAYYRAIYDEYTEGRAYVDQLLSMD